jgi:hypothetical protein
MDGDGVNGPSGWLSLLEVGSFDPPFLGFCAAPADGDGAGVLCGLLSLFPKVPFDDDDDDDPSFVGFCGPLVHSTTSLGDPPFGGPFGGALLPFGGDVGPLVESVPLTFLLATLLVGAGLGDTFSSLFVLRSRALILDVNRTNSRKMNCALR